MPSVKLWLVVVLLLTVDALAVAALLLSRRYGPRRGWFRDAQHASGAFTVTGTIFAVLVGFVFLLAFGSYSAARESSQDEARAAVSLFHVAERFPVATRDELQTDIVCYSRAVVASEWPAMAEERSSTTVDHWETRLSRDFDAFEPTGQVEGDALQNWFSGADLLREARQGRLTEAPRFIPATIWFLLLVAGLAVVGFALLLSDPREKLVAQAAMVVALTTAVAASLLIVNFLDRPYGTHQGSIKPAAMESALAGIRRDLLAHDRSDIAACDVYAEPRTAPANG
jgi:hypothetical protein